MPDLNLGGVQGIRAKVGSQGWGFWSEYFKEKEEHYASSGAGAMT